MHHIDPALRKRGVDEFDAGQHICVQLHTTTTCDLHWHNYFEVEIITSGTGTHLLNGIEYPIAKGSAYLLTPTDFHAIVSDTPIQLVNLSFDEEVLTEKMLSSFIAAGTGTVFQLDDDTYQRVITAADLLRHECRTGGPCQLQLCEYLLSSLFRGNASVLPDRTSSGHLTGIKKAILYLELHFREPISLSLLAEQAGFTPGYFSELFRQITGEPYIERLNTLRIGYARTLLKNGLSVSEACFASGFGSLSNFLATFKRKCHMTPSEYQEQCKASS